MFCKIFRNILHKTFRKIFRRMDQISQGLWMGLNGSTDVAEGAALREAKRTPFLVHYIIKSRKKF